MASYAPRISARPSVRLLFAAPIFVAGLLLISGFGCSKRSGHEGTGNPILLFAVDGLEWRLAAPLLRQGKLPTLAGLIEKGRYGYLETMEPTLSAVIWTSVATGKIPERHGIENFVYRLPSSIGGEPRYKYYTSGHRKTKAFWNIFSDFDLEVVCIGWWITYPAEEINGVMVSQTNTLRVLENPHGDMMKGSLLRGVEGQVYPPERQNEVMAILEEVDRTLKDVTGKIFGRFPNPPDSLGARLWNESLWAFRADETYARVAEAILSSGEAVDLFAVYLGGTDVVAHRFWRYAFPEEFDHPPGGDQIANFSGMLEKEYRYVDETIGRIISLFDRDPIVIVVSDHGMHAANTRHRFAPDDPPWLRVSGDHLDAPPGVFIASGPPIKAQRKPGGPPEGLDPESLDTVGSILDITPTLLFLAGIPLGKDMYGRALKEIFEEDWLERHPLKYVDTHDDADWLASRKKRMKGIIDEQERLEQLRSLGYIE